MSKNTQRKDASSNLPINSWGTPNKPKKNKFNLSRKQIIGILIAFLICVALLSVLAVFSF